MQESVSLIKCHYFQNSYKRLLVFWQIRLNLWCSWKRIKNDRNVVVFFNGINVLYFSCIFNPLGFFV